MKPAWDKLMEKYAAHESILVADVDCIGAGKSKCDDVGVKGFPTIKSLGGKLCRAGLTFARTSTETM